MDKSISGGCRNGISPPTEIVSNDVSGRWMAKIDRAADIFSCIEQEVDEWNESNRFYAPTRVSFLSDKDLEIYKPDYDFSPQLARWESSFDDGVHNLRAALDGLVWKLSHINGESPANPRAVTFPIVKAKKSWNNASGRALASVPESLRCRIRDCQPWARPDPQSPDPLILLSQANNEAKHRDGGFEFDILPILQYGVRQIKPPPEHLSNVTDWQFAPWVKATVRPAFTDRFAALFPVFVIPVVKFDGNVERMPNAARWLHFEIRRIVHYISTGEWQGGSEVSENSTEWLS